MNDEGSEENKLAGKEQIDLDHIMFILSCIPFYFNLNHSHNVFSLFFIIFFLRLNKLLIPAKYSNFAF